MTGAGGKHAPHLSDGTGEELLQKAGIIHDGIHMGLALAARLRLLISSCLISSLLEWGLCTVTTAKSAVLKHSKGLA